MRAASVVPVLVAWLFAVVSCTLSPLGTPSVPFSTTQIEQTAFDADTSTLYLANSNRHTIIAVVPVSSVPITPLLGTPWSYSIAAGVDNAAGFPSLTEVPGNTATFNAPTGVVGWPSYAVGPSFPVHLPRMWVGLWVCDFNNHAIRFVNFRRNHALTLVAGSNTRVNGSADGLGTAASLWTPETIAYTRFPSGLVGVLQGPNPPAWTPVVLWSEHNNACVRQGVPMHAGLAPLSGSVAESLQDMVLDVKSFVGSCGTAAVSPVTGAAYQTAILRYPIGIALVNPFPPFRTTVQLFIAEDINARLSVVVPLFPAINRYLTTVYNGMSTAVVNIVRVMGPTSVGSGVYQSSVEVFVGTTTSTVLSITVSLQYVSATNGATVLGATNQVLTTTSMMSTSSASLVQYSHFSALDSMLLVLNGVDAVAPLQFYCCLSSVDYSRPIHVDSGDGAVTSSPTASPSASVSSSMSPSLSMTSEVSSSLSRTATSSGSNSASSTGSQSVSSSVTASSTKSSQLSGSSPSVSSTPSGPSATVSMSPSSTSTSTSSASISGTPTGSPSWSPTVTPSKHSSSDSITSASPSYSGSDEPSASSTASITVSGSPSDTVRPTASRSDERTGSRSATATQTDSTTAQLSLSRTVTISLTGSSSLSMTTTVTKRIPPTLSNEATSSMTPTVTLRLVPTRTLTPSFSVTISLRPTNSRSKSSMHPVVQVTQWSITFRGAAADASSRRKGNVVGSFITLQLLDDPLHHVFRCDRLTTSERASPLSKCILTTNDAMKLVVLSNFSVWSCNGPNFGLGINVTAENVASRFVEGGDGVSVRLKGDCFLPRATAYASHLVEIPLEFTNDAPKPIPSVYSRAGVTGAVATSVVSSVAAAFVGNPSMAAQVSRMAMILSLLRCDDALPELGPTDHPTTIRISLRGSSSDPLALYLGAVLGDLLLMLGVALVVLVAAEILFRLTQQRLKSLLSARRSSFASSHKDEAPVHSSSTITRVQHWSSVRFPGILSIPGMMWVQPVTTAIIVLFCHAEATIVHYVVASVTALIILLTLFFTARLLVFPSIFGATFIRSREPVRSMVDQIAWFLGGNHKWVPNAANVKAHVKWVRHFGFLFVDYRQGAQWFFIVELLLSIVVGVLGGVPTLGNISTCQAIASLTLIAFLLYFGLLCGFWPMMVMFNKVVIYPATLLQIIGLCAVVYILFTTDPGADPNPTAAMIAVTLPMASAYIMLVKQALDVCIQLFEVASRHLARWTKRPRLHAELFDRHRFFRDKNNFEVVLLEGEVGVERMGNADALEAGKDQLLVDDGVIGDLPNVDKSFWGVSNEPSEGSVDRILDAAAPPPPPTPYSRRAASPVTGPPPTAPWDMAAVPPPTWNDLLKLLAVDVEVPSRRASMEYSDCAAFVYPPPHPRASRARDYDDDL